MQDQFFLNHAEMLGIVGGVQSLSAPVEFLLCL